MRIFKPLQKTSQYRTFSSCNYEEPIFKFGYIGAFLMGGFFTYALREDHKTILSNMHQLRTEIKDIATKQQNDNARIISLIESKK